MKRVLRTAGVLFGVVVALVGMFLVATPSFAGSEVKPADIWYAAPVTPQVDCSACHNGPTSAAVVPGNYLYNPNGFAIEAYNVDPQDGVPQTRYPLGSGKSTDEAPLFWKYARGVYMPEQRCFRLYKTASAGSLGWNFWHQFYAAAGSGNARGLYLDTRYDWKVVVGPKGVAC